MNRLHSFDIPSFSRLLKVEKPVASAVTGDAEALRQFQQLSREHAELKRELMITQQQLKAAQRHIEMLKVIQTSLRKKLIRLVKKCTKTRHFAYHDTLTGLPNRSLLMDRLKQSIAQATRQDKQVALLFIDLDKFKAINDRFGHWAGDRLLQMVAERLSACIRYCDTACRYGGDEFVILLPEIAGQDNVAAVTKKIRTQLHQLYRLGPHTIRMTASIGSSVCRPNGNTGSDLIKQADRAMYRTKACRDRSLQDVLLNRPHPTHRLLEHIRIVVHRLFRFKSHNHVFENQSEL